MSAAEATAVTSETANGSSERTTRSARVSTSAPTRASRSPRRSPATVAGSAAASRTVEPLPQGHDAAQRDVVTDEPFDVAQDAAADPERPRRDDGHLAGRAPAGARRPGR